MAVHGIEIRLLGEPTIVVGDEVRPVTRPREQALLARLALAAPSAVPSETLVDDVWGDAPPSSVIDSLRVHVSNLRKTLAGGPYAAADVLVTSPSAYRLEVDRSAVDVLRLESAVRERDEQALRTLLGPWPDQDLGRLETGSGFFAGVSHHLVELRAAGTEAIAEADLSAGVHERATAAVQGLLRREPYRERSWELLVRGMSASGRRTEALRAAQRARQTLAEAGMEPGPSLASAEEAVLREERAPAPQLPASDYVDVDGSKIAFRTMGSHGTDLLLLCGGFIPFEVMPDEPRFARFLTRLAERHRVILLDRRGIGMSDPPADGNPVSLDHWVDDCRAVLDAAGSDQCLILANENGGPVAIRLAAEDAGRVRGLVLHNTAAKYLRSADHPYGPTEEVYDRVNRMIDRLPGAEDTAALVAPSVGDDPAFRAWLDRAGRLGAGPGRARELHRVYFQADVRSYLADVRAPTIVFQAARRLRSDPGQARYLTEHLPDAELQLLDSADHLPFLTDADAVIEGVRRVAQRTEAPVAEERKVLRALLAVAPALENEVLGDHRPETCLEVKGALVAVFPSSAAAERCAAALAEQHPDATVVVELADTLATADDDAVVAVADAARRRRRR